MNDGIEKKPNLQACARLMMKDKDVSNISKQQGHEGEVLEVSPETVELLNINT